MLVPRLSSLLAPLVLALTLACGSLEATPPPNEDFVGRWATKDGSAQLAISPEGHVTYHRKQGASTTSIDAPAQAWTETRFTVGVFGIETDFTIDGAPRQVEGVWTMTVDGLEYTRAN